jgi:hypothetical protein
MSKRTSRKPPPAPVVKTEKLSQVNGDERIDLTAAESGQTGPVSAGSADSSPDKPGRPSKRSRHEDKDKEGETCGKDAPAACEPSTSGSGQDKPDDVSVVQADPSESSVPRLKLGHLYLAWVSAPHQPGTPYAVTRMNQTAGAKALRALYQKKDYKAYFETGTSGDNDWSNMPSALGLSKLAELHGAEPLPLHRAQEYVRRGMAATTPLIQIYDDAKEGEEPRLPLPPIPVGQPPHDKAADKGKEQEPQQGDELQLDDLAGYPVARLRAYCQALQLTIYDPTSVAELAAAILERNMGKDERRARKKLWRLRCYLLKFPGVAAKGLRGPRVKSIMRDTCPLCFGDTAGCSPSADLRCYNYFCHQPNPLCAAKTETGGTSLLCSACLKANDGKLDEATKSASVVLKVLKAQHAALKVPWPEGWPDTDQPYDLHVLKNSGFSMDQDHDSSTLLHMKRNFMRGLPPPPNKWG